VQRRIIKKLQHCSFWQGQAHLIWMLVRWDPHLETFVAGAFTYCTAQVGVEALLNCFVHFS
jgi:hypothetical protein